MPSACERTSFEQGSNSSTRRCALHRGDGDDSARDVVELADGRLVVVGVSDRSDLGPISHGVYVVTTDAASELQWEATFGGFGGNEVTLSADGNLVVVGGNTSDGSRTLSPTDRELGCETPPKTYEG